MKNKMVRSALSLTLAASLVATGTVPSMAASSDPNSSAAREAENARISQRAATEGMVLLDNRGALPISKTGRVALYGTGVYATVKGGTGSGDVYLKEGANIDVQQGFEDAGYNVINKAFLAEQEAKSKESGGSGGGMFGGTSTYNEEVYDEAVIDEAAAEAQTAVYVLARNSGEGADRKAAKGDYYLTDNEAANLALLGQKFEDVIVVLNAGGIIDTNFYNGKGNYGADDEFNRGKIEGLDALLLMSQAGQNGGHAVVEVLNGTVNPSGKLTDTWAVDYEDYPSSAEFSSNDGETLEERYTDDIYVGYRYFDTFGKDVAYEFGYGSSYTDFTIDVTGVTADEKTVTVEAAVTNTGSVAGKEVVEVYFSAPQGALDKPFQELAGYQKVAVEPGATEQVTVTFDTADMSSYDESRDVYVLEDGTYTIRVGNSSRNTVEAAALKLDADVVTEECKNNLGVTREQLSNGTYGEGYVLNNTYEPGTRPGQTVPTPQYGSKPIEGILDGDAEGYGTGITPGTNGLTATRHNGNLKSENFAPAETHTYQDGAITTYVSSDKETDSAKYAAGKKESAKEKLVTVDAAEDATLVDVVTGNITMEQLVADMSNVELADFVEGGTYDGLSAGGGDQTAVIGSQAESVYGAAGETTSNLYVSRYIPNVVMSDGPAGIRITNSYIMYDLVAADAPYDPEQTYYTARYSWSGNIYTEKKFADEAEYLKTIAEGVSLYTTDGTTYYQYCTAFPIGTLLAQTWDPDLIEEVGRAVGVEMLEYGVTSWLAPGMNIHRNPLCGRNFEYYSEDPLVSGLTAAAETRGVETKPDGSDSGVGVTLKHFAFNSQENSRMGSNSVVSERAAREIYLKGFEIAVRNAQPDYIMSSYNMVNGYATFEHYGLLTEILRNEWGFEGFVMTDWYSVGTVYGKLRGQNVQSWLMYAGNDCEMPGGNERSVLNGLSEGTTMRLGDLQRSAVNMLHVIARSAVFDKLFQTLVLNDTETAAKYFKQQLAEAQKRVEELEQAGASAAEELKKAQQDVASLQEQLKKLEEELADQQKGERTEMEKKNAEISRRAAEEGIVLLENENGVLPLAKDSKAAVFGTANYGTIKGGTGSGDVYNKYLITIYDGLQSAYKFSNQSWWDSYIRTFEEKKAQALREKKSNDYATYVRGGFGGADSVLAIDQVLSQVDMTNAKANGVDTAIYTISRTSGEGADRAIGKGEYYLSDVERANIELMAANFDKTIVLLNVGGIIDTKFFKEVNGLDSLVLVSQAGMEGGNAVANILTGNVTPSGKLSDTWAVDYEDYPASDTIGDHDGNTTQEDYTEGIYVGYRYFDSFNITPAYEFGYGKSYTDFTVTPVSVKANADTVDVTVNVKNTGDTYSGKEVVEVYFSAPEGAIEKPYQELAGFAKTDVLAPGESQKLTVSYRTTEMSSYSEEKAAYIMEDGEYIVRVGNSSRNTKAAAVLTLAEDVTTEQLSNQLTADREFDELSAAGASAYGYEGEAAEIAAAEKIALAPGSFTTEHNASEIDEDAVTTYLTEEDAKGYKPAANETVEIVEAAPEGTKLIDVYNGKVEMKSFLAGLTNRQLANIVNGISGADKTDATDWGSEANSVKGAAGETTGNYGETLGIPNTVEADGPAGVRVTEEEDNATAFPIGTLLAQTWNVDILTEVGKAIGEEMNAFGVTLWLAPGMNIHRDPMNGRNFEYYSEDPALTGFVGSCITAGVQSNPGVGVTIKHYITNNQETSRNQVNTSVSERALREIYLKGFEMVIKSTQPMAIMSSYNKVNGAYACENFDLLESIPRGEWGFDGMVMTDWGAGGRASVSGMMHSGNDLVMPGSTQTRIINALAGNPSHNNDRGKTLILGDVQKCAGRVLTMITRSLQFGRMYKDVEVKAHTSTYNNLTTYLSSAKDKVTTAEVNDMKDTVVELESTIRDLNSEIAAKTEELNTLRGQIEGLEGTVDSQNAELVAAKEKLAAAEAAVEELQAKAQELAAVKSQMAELEEKARGLESQLGAQDEAVKAAKQEVEAAKQEALNARNEALNAKQEVVSAMTDLALAKSDAERAKADAEKAKQDAEQAKQDAANAKAEADKAKQDAENANKTANALADKVEKQNEQLKAAEEKLLNAQKAANELKAQLGSSDDLAKAAMAQVEAAQKELKKLQFKTQDISLKKASGKKNAFAVSWKKVSGADGYQISYAAKSNFKKAKKVTVGSKSVLTVKKLKANKKYYVRVRAYKTIDGTKVYTGYSGKRSVKTK